MDSDQKSEPDNRGLSQPSELQPLALRNRRSSSRSVFAAGLCSAAVGFIAFLPALHNDFVYDDLPIIVQNRTVTESGHWYRFWREPWWPRGVAVDRLYRPLTLASYRFNLVIQRFLPPVPFTTGRPDASKPDIIEIPADAPNPFWFHMGNLLLHGLTCAGVALLAYRCSGRPAAAWIAGLLFAAHPIHAEAVVTGVGRAELMTGLFGAWLLALYVVPPDVRPRRPRFYVVTSLLFLAALMSKEHALFLWPMLLLIDLRPPQRAAGPRPGWREWLNRSVGPPHAGFALAYATFFTLRTSVFLWRLRLPPADVRHWEAPMGHATLIEHFLTPLRLFWLTFKLCAWPPALCPIWAKSALQLADRFYPDVVAGMVVLVLILVTSVLLLAKRKPLGDLLLGMLCALAMPTQAISLANWFYAERWLYLPTVIIAAIVGLLLSYGRKPAIWAAAAIAIVLLPQSWAYTPAFHDNYALFHEVVERQPDNLQAAKALPYIYLTEGNHAAAIETGRDVIRRFGDLRETYQHLALAELAVGDAEGALAAIDKFAEMTVGLPGYSMDRERLQALQILSRARARTSPATAQSVPASSSSPSVVQ